MRTSLEDGTFASEKYFENFFAVIFLLAVGFSISPFFIFIPKWPYPSIRFRWVSLIYKESKSLDHSSDKTKSKNTGLKPTL